MTYDKKRKAYLLSQMINSSFQQTAFFLWPEDPSSSKNACLPSRALYGLPKLNLNLHPTTTLFRRLSRGPKSVIYIQTQHVSKFSRSWVELDKLNEVPCQPIYSRGV